MKWIKKHKLTTFVLVLYVILIVFAFFINKIFFSANRNPVYGDRLDGIEEVKIEQEQYTKMKQEMEDGFNISSIKTDLKGKILNIIVTVGDEITLEQAKGYGSKTLEYFDSEQLAFYDFQIFIKKNNAELNNFPIIGYKHYTKSGLTWTKDRQVSE